MLQTLTGKLWVGTRYNDIILAFAVVSITMLLIIPLNPTVLDALISMSIVISVLTLLVTLYSEESLSFSSFPSLLLIITLFRLGLNIAATRMILTEAQAGSIIKTFGEFVTGGNQFVGFLIFILLTGINFVVITKGSGRVAEVAARFYLDSLPGKQMAIDADVNAGIINEAQAQKRREKIISESDFYGAMDGASKFVRGDAIAGIVITVIIMVGGVFIGIGGRGLPWADVVRTYITLSIGDGLVTQIPALLVSVAAGIIVTRSSSKQHLADLFRQEIFDNPKILVITALILALLSLLPGMPKLVMLVISGIIYFYAQSLLQEEQRKGSIPEYVSTKEREYEAGNLVERSGIEEALLIHPLELELGEKISPLAQQARGELLVRKITAVRQQVASELGIVVPSIKFHDNKFLPPDTYVIKIKGGEVDSFVLYPDLYLAMNPGHVAHKLPGIQTLEPAFKLPAVWIARDQKEHAEALGYAVADPISILSTHIMEVIHTHAYELLNRQDVARLLENARLHDSAVVEELVPSRLSLGDILKVLQNLLRERISIRDFISILEIIADNSVASKDIDTLTQFVRIGMARTISKQYMDQNKTIHAITFDPKVEQLMQEGIQKNEFGAHIVLHPGMAQNIIEAIRLFAVAAMERGIQAVVLTSSVLRPYTKRFIDGSLPQLPVLAFNEVVREAQIVSVGVIAQETLIQ